MAIDGASLFTDFQAPNQAIVSKLEKHGHECAMAAPVWHELIFGCRRLPSGIRRRALEIYLGDVVRASFPILALEQRSKKARAGSLRCKALRSRL